MNIKVMEALMKEDGIGPSELSRRIGMQRSAGTALLKGRVGTRKKTYESRLEEAFKVPAGSFRGDVEIPKELDDFVSVKVALRLIALAKLANWETKKVKRAGWRFLYATLENVDYDFAAWLDQDEKAHSAVKVEKK